nr:MAG TPA: hypothetical protein [Caudoviricetes sp.]
MYEVKAWKIFVKIKYFTIILFCYCKMKNMRRCHTWIYIKANLKI